MATKKSESLGALNLEQLKGKLLEVEAKFKEHRFEKVVGDARQTHELKKCRKDVARIKTYIRQYELGIKK